MSVPQFFDLGLCSRNIAKVSTTAILLICTLNWNFGQICNLHCKNIVKSQVSWALQYLTMLISNVYLHVFCIKLIFEQICILYCKNIVKRQVSLALQYLAMLIPNVCPYIFSIKLIFRSEYGSLRCFLRITLLFD